MYQKIFEQYFHLKRNKYACYHLLGKKSLQLRPKLVKSVQKNLRLCHIKAVFQSPSKLHLLFRFKDTLDEKILSDLVCRYACRRCNATYYGKTYRHFLTRAA